MLVQVGTSTRHGTTEVATSSDFFAVQLGVSWILERYTRKMKRLMLVVVGLFATSLAVSTPSRGLGLTRTQWEANHKKTGFGNLGVQYGDVEVLFAKNRVQQIMLLADTELPAQEAISSIKSFLPRDAKATTQVKNEKKSNVVFNYSSASLGKLHFQYNNFADLKGLTRLMIALGDKPVSAMQASYPKKPPFFFANCEDLNEKFPDGVGNWHASYRPKLDRNNNGWACEPTPR